jgi:hypothetical protein
LRRRGGEGQGMTTCGAIGRQTLWNRLMGIVDEAGAT